LTAGCIGLDGGHGENVAFNALMADYFKTKKVINVSVDLAGNANVVRQLGNQPHY
jgi:Na+/glutamate symporter